MTEWDLRHRYQTVEQALEDVSLAAGVVLATLRGAAGFRNPDLQTMLRLFRASNEMQREKGIEIAVRLGKAALPELHSLLGHSRREVRNAAAAALGRVLDTSSVPLLVAALYGNSDKASTFRPAADTASDSLSHFPAEERLRAVGLIQRPVRPEQVVTIVRGMAGSAPYDAVLALKSED